MNVPRGTKRGGLKPAEDGFGGAVMVNLKAHPFTNVVEVGGTMPGPTYGSGNEIGGLKPAEDVWESVFPGLKAGASTCSAGEGACGYAI
jgi:hypothetical protein